MISSFLALIRVAQWNLVLGFRLESATIKTLGSLLKDGVELGNLDYGTDGFDHVVGDVVDLLVDMDCLGLKPSFSMIEKVISLYWIWGRLKWQFSFETGYCSYSGCLAEPQRRPNWLSCLEDDGFEEVGSSLWRSEFWLHGSGFSSGSSWQGDMF
ncbi:hypothetical protein HHK36_016145 [Tetracentron sinense]|uniref:Uncharacterized protein n=1 Tax=Tetracentron sinense TaxID=13715 RepID=A0A834YZ69_TETSI|nr:hypothetical protein HHK36_016145 [Tetracentron sinense]